MNSAELPLTQVFPIFLIRSEKEIFKRLDLIDRVPDELCMEVRDIVQETGIKTIPKKNKCKNAKQLSEEALQIAVKRREVKSKGEKELCIQMLISFIFSFAFRFSSFHSYL